ncbi:MAG: hypothetical protein RR889_08090, partial [Akkermansia sp.]
GLRWEPDATLRFAPLTQHVLPQTPPLRNFSNKFPDGFFSNYPAMSLPLGVRWEPDATRFPLVRHKKKRMPFSRHPLDENDFYLNQIRFFSDGDEPSGA